MRAPAVVVVRIRGEGATKMALAEDYSVVESLAAKYVQLTKSEVL
jgi:hypothetical protein